MNANQPDLRKLQAGVIAILITVYILQVFTPLRLSIDTVVLLSAAESAARGDGPLYHGQPTQYPPGYPLLIAVLIRLGIAKVWVIVGVSVGSILLGLALARFCLLPEFFSDERALLAISIVSLLSFVTIKYTVIPLTDPLFFGAAMACLAVMRSAAYRFTWRKLALSAVLVLISISVRKIGITLIPALLWVVAGRPEVRRYVMRLSFPMKAAGVFLAAITAGIAVWRVGATSTMRRFALIDNVSAALGGHTLLGSISSILGFHFKELGEIAVNLPFPALPPAIQHALPFAGAAAFLLVLGGLFSRRRNLGAMDIFFMSYCATILVWPFYDPRFWLPVLPFLVSYTGLSIKCCVEKGVSALVFEVWALGFAALGALVLASSTILSFSGSTFGDKYYTDRFRATYCAAGYCEHSLDQTQPVDADALDVLQTFN